MSTKNNALLAAAALAVGIVPTVGAKPVAEGLLNDYNVNGMAVSQVDDSGRCIVFVTVPTGTESGDEIRPVSSASGDVKLFSDLGAVASLIKKAKLAGGVVVEYARKVKAGTVGDPVVTLKAQYKQIKAELLTGQGNATKIAAKIAAAVALGWDIQSGTPEAEEYADYLAKEFTIGEWVGYCTDRKAALHTALVAAGVAEPDAPDL